MRYSILLFTLLAFMTQFSFAQEDPYIWLENVDAERSLKWVEKWNEKSLAVLTGQPNYKNIYEKNLEIYNSTDRIASPSIYGDYIYNFWQDKEHVRGIWRRTSLKNYLSKNTEWEIVIDIDKISEEDNEKYVFKGAVGLFPNYNKFLVSLSKGGGDAVIVKEFDAKTKTFIEGGFYLPEAKGSASWIDENTLMVSTDFGDGMTTSGYPKQVKTWKRGTDLKDAKLIFEGKEDDVSSRDYTLLTKNKTYQLVMQSTSFYSGNYFVIEKGELIKLDLPEDIELSTIFNELVIFQLKSDWIISGKTFKQGSVVSIKYDELVNGNRNFDLIVEPDERSSVAGISNTKNILLVNMLNNVKSELYKYTWSGKWAKERIDAPQFGNI